MIWHEKYCFFNLRNQMFIKSPGAGVGWGTFVEPMTVEMWICTLLMTIIGSFVVTVTYYIGKKFNDVEDLPFTFGSVIFMSFSFFFQQGKVTPFFWII